MSNTNPETVRHGFASAAIGRNSTGSSLAMITATRWYPFKVGRTYMYVFDAVESSISSRLRLLAGIQTFAFSSHNQAQSSTCRTLVKASEKDEVQVPPRRLNIFVSCCGYWRLQRPSHG